MTSAKSMYRMPSVVRWDREPELPTGMYRLSNPHSASGADGIVGSVPDVMAQVVRLLQRPSKLLEMLETRQIRLLEQLESLQKQMRSMRENLLASDAAASRIGSTTEMKCHKTDDDDLPRDAVINVDSERIPYSLLALKKIFNIDIGCYTHSSVSNLASAAKEFNERLSSIKITKPSLKITLIWKKVGVYTELVMSSIPNVILGEVNLLRFIVSVMKCSLSYRESDNFWEVDSILDTCHSLQSNKSAKERSSLLRDLNSKLGKNKWFASSSDATIADLALWSIVKQLNMRSELTDNMKNWMKTCDNSFDI